MCKGQVAQPQLQRWGHQHQQQQQQKQHQQQHTISIIPVGDAHRPNVSWGGFEGRFQLAHVETWPGLQALSFEEVLQLVLQQRSKGSYFSLLGVTALVGMLLGYSNIVSTIFVTCDIHQSRNIVSKPASRA